MDSPPARICAAVLRLGAAWTLLVGCLACTRPAPDELAVWSGGSVRAGQVDNELAALSEKQRQPPDGESLESWIRSLIEASATRSILFERANESGVTRDQVVLMRARSAANLEIGFALVQERCPLEAPGEDEVRSVYDRQIGRAEQEWILVRHIFRRRVASDGGGNQAVREHLGDLLSQLEEGASFIELARRHSESETADKGGLVGRISRQAPMERRFVEVAWELEDGEVSGIVELDNGFHVILREDSGVQAPPDFDTVRPRLVRRLSQISQEACGQRLVSSLAEGTPVRSPEEGWPLGAAEDQVLLWVGEEEFSAGQLDGLAPVGASLASQPTALALVRQFVEAELLAREARAANPAQDEAWKAIYDAQLRRFAVADQWLRDRAQMVSELPEAELRAFYEDNRGLFQDEAEVDVDVILLSVSRQRNERETVEEARRLAALIAAGENMSELAVQHSEHASAGNGGRLEGLGWSRVRTLFGQGASEAIGAMEVGELTEPLLLARKPVRAYGLVRLHARRPPRPVEFETARERVVAEYAAQRAVAIESQLRARLLEGADYTEHRRAIVRYVNDMAAVG